jgi:hypothetical protein
MWTDGKCDEAMLAFRSFAKVPKNGTTSPLGSFQISVIFLVRVILSV